MLTQLYACINMMLEKYKYNFGQKDRYDKKFWSIYSLG